MAGTKPGLDSGTEGPGNATQMSEITACMEAICASPSLAGSKKLIRFLRFVVAGTLRGAGDGLNEYSIGVDVYDRADSFDPRIDNIVRVEARRLRAKLDEYYRTAGAQDDWIIDLPREGDGTGPPDARGGCGHEGALALESIGHGGFLV